MQTRSFTSLLSILLLIGLSAALSACENAGPTGDLPGCVDGKCDGEGEAPPALEALALDPVARCTGVLDSSTTDTFFQQHQLRCAFGRERYGVELLALYYSVRDDDGSLHQSGEVVNDELGTERAIATIRNDDFPFTLLITAIFQFEGTGTSYRWGIERVISSPDELAGFTPDAELTVELPFELWPIVMWPDVSLRDAWDAGTVSSLRVGGAHEVALPESGDLAVGGGAAATSLSYIPTVRYSAASVANITAMTTHRIYVPVPVGGSALPLMHTLDLDVTTTEIAFDGPGYYLVGADGVVVHTDPVDLPTYAAAPIDGDAGMTEVDAGTSDVDASTPDVDAGATEPEPEPEPVDPCAGACSASQVCVAAACVARDAQIQMSCYTPVRRCDAGEDEDCAAGHACVAGLCRRLTCQAQTSCFTPTAPCEAGDDTDCDEGHVCVGGTCRRLTCQVQTSCYTPTSRCDDNDDSDCGVDHACVGNVCRRLTCQVQSSCYTPTSPCDGEDSDCGSAHTCIDGVCHRSTCG